MREYPNLKKTPENDMTSAVGDVGLEVLNKNKMSKEYILAIVLVLGSVLKSFGIEIESTVLEGIIVGMIAIIMAILRYRKGDINLVGAKIG